LCFISAVVSPVARKKAVCRRHKKRKGPTTSVAKSLDLLVHLAHQQANYSLYAASGYFSLVEHQFSARLWRTA
jgi:hypothetical protein